ncbi:MAG: hypothetical protein FWG90_05490 [Oscillospiraceae bacterium]|nr:hypothetical protein [Oscillospiraceae bacterium]
MKKGFKALISAFLAAAMACSMSGVTLFANNDTAPTTQTANTEQSSPSEIFGRRKSFSAVRGYDFSQHTNSSRQMLFSESRTYRQATRLMNAKTFYIGMQMRIDNDFMGHSLSAEVFIANSDDRISMIMNLDLGDNAPTSLRAYVDNKQSILYDSETKNGYRVKADNELKIEEMKSELLSVFSTGTSGINAMSNRTIHVFQLTIGGERYIYEYMPSDKTGYLIDKYGELCGVYVDDMFIAFHAFTPKVPSNAFARPSGYTIVDVDELDGKFDIDIKNWF